MEGPTCTFQRENFEDEIHQYQADTNWTRGEEVQVIAGIHAGKKGRYFYGIADEHGDGCCVLQMHDKMVVVSSKEIERKSKIECVSRDKQDKPKSEENSDGVFKIPEVPLRKRKLTHPSLPPSSKVRHVSSTATSQNSLDFDILPSPNPSPSSSHIQMRIDSLVN